MNSVQLKELADSLGADVGDMVQRLELQESVVAAIQRGAVGFRGGWVSTSHISSDLHPRHWAVVLGSIGYKLHPALSKSGRTQVIPKEGRTRLFIKEGHVKEAVQVERHVVRFYRSAQSD